MKLNDLIDALTEVDPKTEIVFDDGAVPTAFDSWRGIYAELALGYEHQGRCLAGDLCKAAEKAVGKTFEGYKGGEFVMSAETPVWRDNYGEYTCTGIMKLVPAGPGKAQLVVADLSDYR
jgi:hypothetical protein